jgi:D-proline reductase (dithiol) PrdB
MQSKVDYTRRLQYLALDLALSEISVEKETGLMALEYLPLMAQSSALKPPRILVLPPKPSWCLVTKPVNESRVALLTSAALRLNRQKPFAPSEDLTYRLIPSDSKASDLVIDHHSRIGPVPRQNPEIVFPMTALASLAAKKIVGSLSPIHISFMGGIRRHQEVENELAPAIARELKRADVDLALLVPY